MLFLGRGILCYDHSLSRHSAAFALNIRERCYLSQGNVNNVVSDVQQYQASLLDNLRDKIKNAFDTHVGSEENLQTTVLAVFDDFKDPFSKVSSTHLQDRSIRHLFNPVEPEEVVISRTAYRTKKTISRALTIKTNSFYYVPLFKSFEELFFDPRIFTMISSIPKRCKEGFLYDIVDGELLRDHPLYSVRHSALQIILYTDEIEICNPLGAHARKNKLLMVYYTLGNIDPKYRSNLSAIRLLAIAKSSELSQCGVDVILDRIKKDLDVLYHGVKIQTAVGERIMYGAVVSLCGDTLAQHEFAGFKEGVGFALCKCRHCEMT
ncbi:uncharacterized protein LOC117561623 [Gymnodraco acuticeps]|uniref:Uncharacterized protein LOC117561623 n=1 Tax=Gymnodraco acuticeps TaxID=8218 RepID=A0A6P8W7V5_GYMAC|nr:uncharacterized protein LOC117561623 [Gymnodraco acuticeps]